MAIPVLWSMEDLKKVAVKADLSHIGNLATVFHRVHDEGKMRQFFSELPKMRSSDLDIGNITLRLSIGKSRPYDEYKRVFELWKGMNGLDATFGVIFEILEKIEWQDPAEDILRFKNWVGVKKVIPIELPPDKLPPSQGSPLPANLPDQLDEIFLTDESHMELVIVSLKKDATLGGSWKTIGNKMGVDPIYLKALSDRWTMGMIDDFDEVLKGVLQKWIKTNGDKATVAALCNILHSIGFLFCEDQIKKAFTQPQ